MNIHSVYRPLLQLFRRARIRLLYRRFGLHAGSRVLDVGGSGEFWRVARDLGFALPRITIVNVLPPGSTERRFPWVIADGGMLPFADGAFDSVVSNSVIEHVGDYDAQLAFGREVARVAKSLFVQTPDFWCPVEPHFLAPVIHWLPRKWRERALPLTPWGLIARPDATYVARMAAEIRLLTAAEMRNIFSGCAVRRGKVLGLPKDIVAFRLG